jgi:hypothetical protein
MYARVVRWEDADPEKMRSSAEEINSRAGSGPPEGVPSTGFLMLIDPEGGSALAVGLFETEEDYAKGDETLNSMDPPGGSFGRRASVTKYEVAVDVKA